MPETAESLTFDEHGVCSVCRQIEYKHSQIDWAERGRALDEILDRHRGKQQYDCIVPFSGGKDSTFTLWYLVKVKKLKPLVVRFDHGFLRKTVQENSLRTFRALGVDVHHFTPNWQVVRKLMFESLRRRGDFCWHCHTGIFSYPMWVSIWQKIPLVIWGEPTAEYASFYRYDEEEEVDERRFNAFVNLGINAEDMLGMLDNTISDYEVTDARPAALHLSAGGRAARRALGPARLLHPVGREEAGRADQARARLAGRPGRGRAARIRLREDRMLHAGRARLHQVPQARLRPHHASGLDRHPQRPQDARGGRATGRRIRRPAAGGARPLPRLSRPAGRGVPQADRAARGRAACHAVVRGVHAQPHQLGAERISRPGPASPAIRPRTTRLGRSDSTART